MQKAGLRLLGGLKFILRRHSVYTAWASLLLLCRISGGREGNRPRRLPDPNAVDKMLADFRFQ